MGIGEKLNKLLSLRGRNINELASSTDISPQTLYSISKRNNTKVDLDILQKISDELCVTLDYFCTNSPDDAKNLNSFSSEEKNIISDFRSLSPKGKEYILQTIQMAKLQYADATDEDAPLKIVAKSKPSLPVILDDDDVTTT